MSPTSLARLLITSVKMFVLGIKTCVICDWEVCLTYSYVCPWVAHCPAKYVLFFDVFWIMVNHFRGR